MSGDLHLPQLIVERLDGLDLHLTVPGGVAPSQPLPLLLKEDGDGLAHPAV